MTYREAWETIYFKHCKETCDYAYMDNCQEEKCEYYMALQALNRQYYAECGSVWVKPKADCKTTQTETPYACGKCPYHEQCSAEDWRSCRYDYVSGRYIDPQTERSGYLSSRKACTLELIEPQTERSE